MIRRPRARRSSLFAVVVVDPFHRPRRPRHHLDPNEPPNKTPSSSSAAIMLLQKLILSFFSSLSRRSRSKDVASPSYEYARAIFHASSVETLRVEGPYERMSGWS